MGSDMGEISGGRGLDWSNRAGRWLRRWCFDPGLRRGWAIAAVLYAAVCGGLAMLEAFAGPYVIQDDARQYGFWMRRFVDGELFPGDWVADYLAAVTPDGYALPFWGAAQVGIDPLLLQKLLPLPLGMLVAWLAWRVAWRWLPVPVAAFAASVLLEQSLWMKDDLVSAAPRALVYPLVLWFLDAYLGRSLGMAIAAIALLAWMSPPYTAIAIAILFLDCWRWWRLRPVLNRDRRSWWWFGVGFGVAIALLLPYVATTSEFGPTVSARVAKTMAEFRSGGRASLFDQNFLNYWFFGKRTNLFPRSLLTPVTLVIGLGLPGLWWWRRRSELVQTQLDRGGSRAVVQLLAGSVGLYGLAHATLFALHLPSRYTGHSFRIAIALAAGVGMALLLDALLSPVRRVGWWRLGGAIALLGVLVAYPLSVSSFPLTGYKTGNEPTLYAFLHQQPKDAVTVSVSKIADNIPPFAARPVYLAQEYAIPYHQGYYREIQRRARGTIAAQYAGDREAVVAFLEDSGATFWLLDGDAFAPTYLNDGFLRQYQPATDRAQAFLRAGGVPWLVTQRDRCTAIAGPTWTLLYAPCLLAPPPPDAPN